MKKINRPKAVTAPYLYSKNRTAKLLGVKTSEIEFVMLLDDGNVLVGLFNDSITIPAVKFTELYSSERKEKAIKEKLWSVKKNNENTYLVVHGRKSKYTVNIGDFLQCECKDYQISSQIFNSQLVCCKHGYAVLNQLGHNSLKDYIKTVCVDEKTV